MKRKMIAATCVLALVAGIVWAQSPSGEREGNRGESNRREMRDPVARLTEALDLTPDQQEKVKQIHMETSRQNLTLHNRIDELEARMKTVMTSETSDQKEVRRIAEQIGDLRGEAFVNKTMNKMTVRALLNEEQKLQFDMMKGRGGKRMHKHRS